ncbi:MAG: hypothetical protein JNL08_20600 [Planctomycetes bacterium]|nr:hypothetical protein [Planctomycetota bacterium]
MTALLRCPSLGLLLTVVPVAAQAEHVAFGAGCVESARESFAAWFPDAAAAAAKLQGQSLCLVPVPDGYAVAWGGASYRAPGTTAAALPPSDDGQVALAPSVPLPTPFGAAATLWVHSNGFVATGPDNDGGAWNETPNDYLPSPAYRNAPAAAFWAWHDWNPAEPGSGRIVHEEVQLGGEPTLCVTWRDVENFPVGVPNRGTFQFQFGLATGRVAYVWPHVDATTVSPFGSAHLVGWSPAGASLDPGFVVLPDALPLTTRPDQHPLALAASPLPRSDSLAGTALTYTTTHVPPLVAGATLRLGFTALSLHTEDGADLAAFGWPGCSAYVGDLDLQLPWLGFASTTVTMFALPAGLPDGLVFAAQSVALVDGGASGGFAVRTSNGLRSRVGPQ